MRWEPVAVVAVLALDRLREHTPSCRRFGGYVAVFPLRRVGPKSRCTPVFRTAVSRARYYNPQAGRFWSADDGEQGSQEDPQSLHLYVYCHGNPVNAVDPSGREGESISLLSAISITTVLFAQVSPASAQGKAAAQQVAGTRARPSSATFWANYPDYSISQQDVWRIFIAGNLGRWGDTPTRDHPTGQNTCATRVSHGLNYSGAAIPPTAPERWGRNFKREWYQGRSGDDKYYITSAEAMKRYLTRVWGSPNRTLRTAAEAASYTATLQTGQCAIFATAGHTGVLRKGYHDPHVDDFVPVEVWVLAVP